MFKELRRPLQSQWIKSHQGSGTDYEKLSGDAKFNVDVDRLATAFHTRPRAKSMPSLPHIPSAAISIIIAKASFYGNLDDNIQSHINGSYLQACLQRRNSWKETTWYSIDMAAFGNISKAYVSPTARPISNLFTINCLSAIANSRGATLKKLTPFTSYSARRSQIARKQSLSS